jgi:nucleotide-binding universal stress UspA family protein
MITAKIDNILVPTDFSDTAAHALRYASALAQRLGARLTIFYADLFVPPIDYLPGVGGWDEGSFDLAQIYAKEQLILDARANIHPSVEYELVVRVATALTGILDQARDSSAGLIVMGTHGRSGFRRLIIGSVTEAVMRHADVPVIAVPPRSVPTAEIKTILCPVVSTAMSREAMTFAAAIAPPDARFIIVSADPDDAAARAWIPEAIAARCEVRLPGDEIPEIEGFAKRSHADLIVAAEPAERTTADVLRGTFAERLLQHSDCPVLSVNRSAVTKAARAARAEAHAEETMCQLVGRS